MRKGMWAALVAAIAAPSVADADYLDAAFRDECLADTSLYYTASDPVIGTVPLVASEEGRVSSNLLVYTGFKWAGTANDYRGHVYGVRLFYEETEYGNDWKFTNTAEENLLATCGDEGSACIFDAGQVLQDRSTPRKIFVGSPGTAALNDGAYTVPIAAAVEVPTSGASSSLRAVWDAYRSLEPIAAAMPKWTSTGWDCSQLPANVPSEICANTNRCDKFSDPLKTWCLSYVETNSSNLYQPSDSQLNDLGTWLHGSNRPWKLGDVYHSSATIVEAPGFQYLDRFYPEFRVKLAKRPPMLYVGANDGMIHAFYAAPDLYWEDVEPALAGPRWQVGEEAWAYMPMNMLAKGLTAVERDDKRFFSQDLSCRYTDVQVDNRFRTECTDEHKEIDPYCGWRTVLLCGQGWGGSWYVALDVTEIGVPKPMWEFTHFEAGSVRKGLGRTWSLPAISLVPMHDASTGRSEPLWLATFGSGYNSSMLPSGTPKTAKKSYRALNLEFDGVHPHHGQGTAGDQGSVHMLDISSGRIVKSFLGPSTNGLPFIADGTVLDFNDDGFVDAAYMAQYKGMHRANFATTPGGMAMCRLSTISKQTVLTGHPTAFAYRAKKDATEFPVVLVTGAGIDSGTDPDQQANQGNIWSVDSDLYMEKPGSTCPTGGFYCDLAPGWNDINDGSRKARLLGAPLFTRQSSGDDWILYTVWTAPHFNKICDDSEKALGNAHLLCMDVTLVESTVNPDQIKPRCVPCEGFDFGKNTMIYENEVMPPTSPVSADGMVYVADPGSGLFVKGVSSTAGDPNPNSLPPTAATPTRLVSWREVF